MPGMPTRPLIDEMLTIEPRPDLQHVRVHRLREAQGGDEVEVDGRRIASSGSSSAALGAANDVAGGVDEDLRRPELSATAARRSRPSRSSRSPATASAADLPGEVGEPVLAAGDDGDPRAGPGQPTGEAGAEAGRGRRHDRHPPVEVEELERVHAAHVASST